VVTFLVAALKHFRMASYPEERGASVTPAVGFDQLGGGTRA
jgi:hypothetical protein